MKKESCSSLNSTWYPGRHAKEEENTSWGTAVACATMQNSRSSTMMMTMMAISMAITTTVMAMVRVPVNNDRNRE